MFAEKLRAALRCIGANTADIGRAVGMDPSGVSRMSSGARVPARSGRSVARLAEGLFLCADERGKVPALCELIGCGVVSSADGLKDTLIEWLYDGMERQYPRRPKPADGVRRYQTFGERFSAVMNLCELSNVRLARMTGLDPSYVSRFRSGLRQPNRKSRVAEEVTAVLSARIREIGAAEELAKLMRIEDGGEACDTLGDWLFDPARLDPSPVIENLLENIDQFSPDGETRFLPWETAASPLHGEGSDGRPYFLGEDGLREAVLLFLGTVIREGGEEMLLYSDEGMDWMVGDAAFRLRWASLMLECVRRGVRIRIIHNLDRDLSEMTDAITSWLPLYMSGRISSWYCRKVRDSRFTHTLFLCPGKACVEACNVTGIGDSALYRYHTDPALLTLYEKAFESLLGESKPLVRIVPADAFQTEEAEAGRGMTVLGTALSLATMPDEVLDSILTRCGADDAVRERVTELRDRRRETLMRYLEEGCVHECIPTADDEDLFAGRVPADIPGVNAAYTPQEYAGHIRAILDLSERYVTYRFYPLPDAPFVNTQITLTPSCAAVSRLKQPCVTFVISHPAICGTFVSYSNRLKDQYKTDKLTLRRTLERYL